MSRAYALEVSIHGYNKDCIREMLEEVIGQELDVWSDGDENINAGTEIRLCGGESEEEYTQRISKEIWKANEGYCKISYRMTYLEDLPYESYEMDEEDYKKALSQKEEGGE